MAKLVKHSTVRTPFGASTAEEPQQIVLGLFTPGMTPMHRAGLGGLACTLRYIERAADQGTLKPKQLPGGPWSSAEQPPWVLSARSITLTLAGGAEEFLTRLFRAAFQIDRGLVYLPGQHFEEPSREVLAELQAGLLLTFLQHGKVRKLSKEPSPYSYDPEGDGHASIIISYKEISWYKHQDGYSELVRNGRFKSAPVEVVGPLNPGSVVRHVAFTGPTKLVDTPVRILPLYFAIVGCVAFPVRGDTGVLLVPDVQDLVAFTQARPLMTPRTARECRIASAADAVMQIQLRLRAKDIMAVGNLPAMNAMTLRPCPWAIQQKSRVSTEWVPPGDEHRLNQFEIACDNLPARVVSRVEHETAGRGRSRTVTKRTQSFWSNSIVRPLVAENLAAGRPWYARFGRLMTAIEHNGKPVRDKLGFERKGLHQMIQSMQWDSAAEASLVRAVHEALRNRYGQIADENQRNPVAMKKRWAGEYDRWRLAFAGAKTADQFRAALCDLFSRGGPNRTLRQEWEGLLPLLGDARWQLSRDLSLLALPSYLSQNDKEQQVSIEH